LGFIAFSPTCHKHVNTHSYDSMVVIFPHKILPPNSMNR